MNRPTVLSGLALVMAAAALTVSLAHISWHNPFSHRTLPTGVWVAPGQPPGSYYVDCQDGQCTNFYQAGPFGTTCGDRRGPIMLCKP